MGAYLSEPQTKKNTKQQSQNDFKFCSSQMQGWRKTMEDADIHCCDMGDGNAIFGIFDGHGGHQVSKYVEQIFIDTLKNNPNYKTRNYKDALTECFKLIDEKIKSQEGQARLRQLRGIDGPINPNSPKISASTGCTANVVLITKEKYIIANIGDSRSALAQKGKKAIQLSFDHKPESEAEKDRIHKAGGEIMMGRVNGGLNLSRSFGDFDYKQNRQLQYHEQMITCHPDILQFNRTNDDEFILIGCDGIWEKYVEDSDGLVNLLKDLLRENQYDYSKALEALLDRLIAKDTKEGVGCDNMTAIIIGFS